MPIVERLVKLLSLEGLTMQEEIQYSLAKSCRLFTESLALQIKCIHGRAVIHKDTKDKYLTLFDNKRRQYDEENVVLHYELKRAHAAAHALKSDENHATTYIGLVKTIIGAATTQSWGDLVQGVVGYSNKCSKIEPTIGIIMLSLYRGKRMSSWAEPTNRLFRR